MRSALANPLRAEEAWLRTRLLPGLLHTVARNQRWGTGSVSIFEVGTVFRSAEPVEERRQVGLVLCGAAGEGWTADDRAFDVLDARGIVETLLEDLGVEGQGGHGQGTQGWTLGEPLGEPFHPGRSARVLLGGPPRRHPGGAPPAEGVVARHRRACRDRGDSSSSLCGRRPPGTSGSSRFLASRRSAEISPS